VDSQKSSPRECIETINEDTTDEAIYKIEYTWAGRYVLIVGNRLFTDCCNRLGVFYGMQCVSSSLPVLCEMFDIDLCYPKIKHGISAMDYMPGENAMYGHFKRLLASQVLNLDGLTTEYRSLLPYGMEAYKNEKARTDAFKKYFECGLQNMRRQLSGRLLCVTDL